MTVTPVVDEGLGNSAYVVDLGDGGGLVVDPERDPRPYATTLAAAGLRPRYVIETHLHADFVSGGLELVAQGAELLAPTGSELAAPHRPLADGDEVALGGVDAAGDRHPGAHPRAPRLPAQGRLASRRAVLGRDTDGRRDRAYRPALARADRATGPAGLPLDPRPVVRTAR